MKKCFTKTVVVLAALMGLSAVFLPPQYIDSLILFSKFFEAMIPVLAVGALVKYLLCCPACKSDEHSH
jgi:hypothetical protein